MGSNLGLEQASGLCLWDREFARTPRLQNSVPFSFFYLTFVCVSHSLSHSVSFYLLRVSLSMGLTSFLSHTFGLLVLLLHFLFFHRHFQTRVSHQLTQGDSSCTALPGIRILHCHYHITLLFFHVLFHHLRFAQHSCLYLCPVLCLASVAVVLLFCSHFVCCCLTLYAMICLRYHLTNNSTFRSD